MRVEPALGDLPERDREQPVGGAALVGRPVLEGYVEQALDLAPAAADGEHGVVVTEPDQRPRVVPLQRGERGRRGRVVGMPGSLQTVELASRRVSAREVAVAA